MFNPSTTHLLWFGHDDGIEEPGICLTQAREVNVLLQWLFLASQLLETALDLCSQCLVCWGQQSFKSDLISAGRVECCVLIRCEG